MTGLRLDDLADRHAEILRRSIGIDYTSFGDGPLAFDYDGLMRSTGYSLDDVRSIQSAHGVGSTPLLELKNVTRLVRSLASRGNGARIFVKDEASNPSGSFKDRRASLSLHTAARLGYPGVVAATSGNYGAAIASQAAMYGRPALDRHPRGL